MKPEAFMLLGGPPDRIGVEDAPAVAAAIALLGCRRVILKLRDRGCWFHGAGEGIFAPAFQVDAKDATAAGDTFDPALAVALAEGSPMPHALRFANAAAAISQSHDPARRLPPACSAPKWTRCWPEQNARAEF